MDPRADAARGETKEQKKARVAQHRQEVLSRIQSKAKEQRVHKKENFLCSVEFENTLPEVPPDPKLVKFPHLPDRAYRYNVLAGSSAESVRTQELLSDPMLPLPLATLDEDESVVPVPVGLFLGARKRDALPEPQRRAIEAHKARLDPLDREITSDRTARPVARAGVERPEAPSTDWTHLRTVFQSDMHSSVYQMADPAAVQQETLAVKLRKARRAAGDAAPAVERVQQTFEAAQRWDELAASGRLSEARHPDKAKARRGVTAVAVTALVPDAGRWEEAPLAALFETDPASGSGVGEEGGGVILRQTPRWAQRGVTTAEDGMSMQAFVRSEVDETAADGGEAWVLGQQCAGHVVRFEAGDEHVLVGTDAPVDTPPPAGGGAASASAAAGAGGAAAGSWLPVGASIQLARAKPRRRPGTRPVGAAEPGHVLSVTRRAMEPEDADAREEATLPLWSADPEADAVTMHAARATRRMRRAREASQLARQQRAAAQAEAEAQPSSSSSSSSSSSGPAPAARADPSPVVGRASGSLEGGSDAEDEGGGAAERRPTAEDRAKAVASRRSAAAAAVGGLFDDDDDADDDE